MAISDFNKAIELNPDFADAYANRSAAYVYMKEFKKAFTDLERAQKLGSKIEPAYIVQIRNLSQSK